MNQISVINDIITSVSKLPVFKTGDIEFLQQNAGHLTAVMENTQMWRTDVQKRSILNDTHFPTDHAKFHQAMLEQKVQLDQALYLAKDFELKKLEVLELECDLEELGDSKRDEIKKQKIHIETQFKNYELKQMQIAMKYRMDEVRGWQQIQNELLEKMRSEGISEDQIWSKNVGEFKALFFLSLNNLQSLPHTTDSAERSNLISMAVFTYKTAEQSGLLESFIPECTPAQYDSIAFIKKFLGKDAS